MYVIQNIFKNNLKIKNKFLKYWDCQMFFYS